MLQEYPIGRGLRPWASGGRHRIDSGSGGGVALYLIYRWKEVTAVPLTSQVVGCSVGFQYSSRDFLLQEDSHYAEVNVTTLFPPPRRCSPDASRTMPICSVAILHYRKAETPVESFEVGFRASVREIEAATPYRFTWVNVALLEGMQTTATSICEYLSNFDHYWVKSNWEWIVDRIARLALNECPVPRSLLISGTFPPPSEEAMLFYQALYYETQWYHGFAALDRHPLAIHAFGIDTSIMSRQAQGIPEEVEAEWDYLVISKIAYNYEDKRTLKLLDKQGRRLLIGSSSGEKAQTLEAILRDSGVHIQDVVSYEELARVIPTTRKVYVPDAVFGGGERAVLEARAMGVEVEVEPDSPKLQELLTSPIYNSTYYARQLVQGLEMLARQLGPHGGGQGGGGGGRSDAGMMGHSEL